MEDPFYRYKFPAVVLKHEKNKTVMDNLCEIAKKMSRPPILIQKFISYELGTAVITKNDRYILNGTYTNAQLQKCLDKFLQLYVFCSVCTNPETMPLKKLRLQCKACGAITKLDPNNKMSKLFY